MAITSVSRQSLGQNFIDHVNQTGLTLPTPEPQYLFAKWIAAGRLSLAALDAGQSTAQQFVSMAGGGVNVSPALAELALAADSYPGFVTAVDAFGANKGDMVRFQRPVYSTGGATNSDRKLNTGASISTTGMGVATEEVKLELDTFNGPYSSTGSAVQPYAIEETDAKFRATLVSLASWVSLNLVRDYTYWLHYVVRDLLLSGQYTTLANASYTDVSDFVDAGNQKWTLDLLLRAKKTMVDRNVPPFANGNYLAIVPTQFQLDMLEDVDFTKMIANHKTENPVYGYVGSVQNIDIIECTTLKTWTAAGTPLGDKAGTVAAGVDLEEGVMLAPGSLGFGLAQPPHCRFADDTNFGNVAKVVWQTRHALGMLDERNIQRMVAQTG